MMARYFFHVVNGAFNPAEEGVEWANADGVKAQAAKATGEMLTDQGINIWTTKRFHIFVTDEQKLAFDAEDLTGAPS